MMATEMTFLLLDEAAATPRRSASSIGLTTPPWQETSFRARLRVAALHEARRPLVLEVVHPAVGHVPAADQEDVRSPAFVMMPVALRGARAPR